MSNKPHQSLVVFRVSGSGGDLVAHAETVLRTVPNQRHECTQHLGLGFRVKVLGLRFGV